MKPDAPLWVRALAALLPPAARRRIGPPLEATVDEVLREARRRGRGPWLRALVREAGALAGLVIRERVRGASGPGEAGMGRWIQDVRYAVRGLLRSPVTTGVCLVTLAVGVGSVTAILTVVDGVLVRNLAYTDPDRVVFVGELTPDGGFSSVSYENLRDWQAADVFESVAVTVGNSVAVTGDGAPERIRGEFVTASYFDVVGVQPVLGRAVAPGEDVPGGPRTAVLSHGWWQQRFGGDPDVLGRTVVLNNETHSIVGVMPAGFRSPWDIPQAWISFHTVPRDLDRGSRNAQAAIARLHPGQSVDEARDALAGVAEGLARAYPDTNEGWSSWIEPLGPFLASNQRPFLMGLGAAVLLLLLIACANVANLQLARSAARRRELAVRSALGGGRRRLVGLIVAENGLLFLGGGLAGLGVAALGVRGLLALQPAYGRFYDVHLNWRVGLAGLALAAAAGLVFGLVPAWEAFRAAPARALRDGDRGGSGGRGAQRFRSGLVASQVALSVALLVGAGLLARTMDSLGRVDPGFDTASLLTLEFRLPANTYADTPERVAFFDAVVRELDGRPGVVSAALASDLPFSGNGGTTRFRVQGSDRAWDDAPTVRSNVVSPGYFETMGIPLLEGRGFSVDDDARSPLVVVVSESFAERHLQDGTALGRRLELSPDGSVVAEVVGVAGDVRTSLTEPPDPYGYVSYRQNPNLFTSVAVRTPGDPMTVAETVRQAVWAVDSDQPVWEVMPITERIAGSTSRTRFNTVLVVVFAGTALFLAALGLYGVMAFAVRRRERELGVRIALGAAPRAVAGLVFRRGLTLAGIGVALGLVVAWWLGGLLQALLYGVGARDPLTFVGAAVVLLTVATVAIWVPVRRTLALDPAATLHEA